MANYNLAEIARIVKVTRQTIYNWIHTGIIKDPDRNFRGYRVFDDTDLKRLLDHKNKLTEPRR